MITINITRTKDNYIFTKRFIGIKIKETIIDLNACVGLTINPDLFLNYK